MSDYFASQIASGKALDTLLGSKDSSGKPVSDGAALLSFASQYQFYAEATGSGGKPAANVATPQDIVARSSQAGRLNSEYVDGIVSGKALRDKLAGGEDIGTAPVLDRYARSRRGDIAARSFGVDWLNRALLDDRMPTDFLRGAGLLAMSGIGPLRRFAMRQGLMPGADGAFG